MIAPDMATMLVLHFHRCRHRAGGVAEPAVASTCDTTFNCMTIDGDTSTSDTVPAVCDRRGGEARRRHASTMRRDRAARRIRAAPCTI